MIPILIQLQPLDRETSLRTNIYFGSAAEPEALGLNGTTWEPAISRRPRIAQDLASFELDGRFKLATADFIVSLGMSTIVRPERLLWAGAPVTIWRVEDLAWDRRKVEFTGIVRNAPFDVASGRVTMNCMVDRTRVEKPLLTLEFTGAGNLFGDAAMRGQFKPAGFGVNEACQAVWFDSTYNIGMLDGYGNLVSVQAALEGLDDRGAAVANYANYAALKAAIIAKTVKPGQWATALADGLVGLGAPPADGLEWKFHATFGTTLPGAMMRRWIETHAGVVVGDVDTASFAALDAAVPREVRCHFTAQQSVDDLVEQMCLGCNASPLITVQGKFAVTRAVAGAPVATLNRNRSQTPRVLDWRVSEPFDPVFKIIMRGQRPASLTERDAVLYRDDLIPMGVYSALETYRDGMTVYASDGSEWLYIFATPMIGAALPTWPATSNTWWQQLQPRVPLNGSMIGVADGAGTTVNLTSIGSQAVTLAGNSFSRNAGSGDFNACVRGDPLQGPQFIEMDILPGTNWSVINLDDDATSTALASMLVQLQVYSAAGTVNLYVNNVLVANTTLAVGITGKLRIAYDGIRFRAFVNATQIGADQQASATNLTLWAKWHAYNGPALVYTGLRAQPYTSNIWSDEGGTGRPSDNAGTTLTLVPVSSANVEVQGNSVRRSSGTGNWTAGWNSADSILAGAYLSWVHTGGITASYFVGLNDVPITNAANNYTQIDYAVYVPNASGMTVYINGVDQVLGLAAAVAGDVFTVGYDNLTIRLWKTTAAGVTTLLHTYATTAGRRFCACGSLFDLNAVAAFPVKAIRFEPWTNQSWSDIGGPGLPANNATADLVLVAVGAATEVLIGNSYRRTSGANGYFGGVTAASPIIGAQFAEADIYPGNAFTMVGLDSAQADYTIGTNVLAFVYYNSTTGAYFVGGDALNYGNGTTTTGLTGKVRMEYDGLFFRGYVGGTQLGAAIPASAPDLKLWPKWVPWDPNITFTGAAAGAMTNNAWSPTGGPGRPADNSGTTLTLNKLTSTWLTITGNSITQVGAPGTWAVFWSSQTFRKAAVVSWVIPPVVANHLFVCGLGTTIPGAEGDPNGKGYSIYCVGGGYVDTYAPGEASIPSFVAYVAGDTFSVMIDNVNVYYCKNNVPFLTRPLLIKDQTYRVIGQMLWNTVTDILFDAATDNYWPSIGGDTRPQNDATTGYNYLKNGGAEQGNTDFWILGEGSSGTTGFAVNNGNQRSGTNCFNLSKGGGLADTASVVNRAFQVTPGEVWTFRGWFKGSTATASGLYFRLNLKAAAPTSGYVDHTNRDSAFDIVANAAVGTTYVEIAWNYTVPAGVYWISIAIYDWSVGPVALYFDDLFAFKTPTLDRDMLDGTTFGRLNVAELTGGLLRLTQAGGGRRLADVRNMPNVAAMHLGFSFSGTISYTSTPTTATISVTAGTVTSGNVAISYGALSKGITGTASTTVRHYLMVLDPTNAGGAATLLSTTSFATWLSDNGYVCIGYVDVFFPAAGSGGGGGSGGTGCVWDQAWIETRDRGRVQAADLREGEDWIKVENAQRDGFEWELVEKLTFTHEESVRLTAENGFALTLSAMSPMELRSGVLTMAYSMEGQDIPADEDGHGWSRVASVEFVGMRRVANIHCNQKVYFAGDVAYRALGSHNPKP